MNRVARIFMNSRAHAKGRIRTVDRLLEGSAPQGSGDALELGCGAGYASAHIAERYEMNVVGTDADAGSIQTARKKNGESDRLSFRVADATALPFEDSAFDLVPAQNVFHHIGDWSAAALEVARVMRPGGLFLLGDISGPGKAMRLFSKAEKGHGFHDEDALVTLLQERGVMVSKNLEPKGQSGREFAVLFRKG